MEKNYFEAKITEGGITKDRKITDIGVNGRYVVITLDPDTTIRIPYDSVKMLVQHIESIPHKKSE